MNALEFPEFDAPLDRRGTGSLKWERYAGRDILPMWVADMDFAVAPEIISAIQHRLSHPVFGYSVPHASLKEAVCDYLLAEHGVKADPAWLVFLPGMVAALAQTSAAVGEAGDSVIVMPPVYPPFLKVPGDTKRHMVKVPLRILSEAPLRYSLDFEALERLVTPKCRLMLLCSPHNPVGRVFSREEMVRLAEFCVRHDMVLCSDEIHCDLLLEPDTAPFTTALALPGSIQERCITLMAASKTFNIPGLATAFAIIPDATLRRKFIRAKTTFIAECNPIGLHATEAAYRFGTPWRNRLRTVLRRNRDTLAAFLQERLPQVKMPHVEATYLALLDVTHFQLQHPIAHFEKHGLGFSNGDDFDAPGHVRLNFGCPHATLLQALDRLEVALRR